MWQLSTYFEDGKVLESTVSLFLIESNRLHPEYFPPPNIESNSKGYLDKYFKNIIEKPGKQPHCYYIILLQLQTECLVL